MDRSPLRGTPAPRGRRRFESVAQPEIRRPDERIPIQLEPQVSAEDLAACNEFIDDVPRRLAGEERRKVNPANSLGAAWGDPAIIVRCGVDVPAEFDEFAACEVANDVGYVPLEARVQAAVRARLEARRTGSLFASDAGAPTLTLAARLGVE